MWLNYLCTWCKWNWKIIMKWPAPSIKFKFCNWNYVISSIMNNNDYFASVSVLCFYLNFNVICKCPMSCKKASTILKCWTVYITYLTVTGNVLDCICYFKHCKVSNEQIYDVILFFYWNENWHAMHNLIFGF